VDDSTALTGRSNNESCFVVLRVHRSRPSTLAFCQFLPRVTILNPFPATTHSISLIRPPTTLYSTFTPSQQKSIPHLISSWLYTHPPSIPPLLYRHSQRLIPTPHTSLSLHTTPPFSASAARIIVPSRVRPSCQQYLDTRLLDLGGQCLTTPFWLLRPQLAPLRLTGLADKQEHGQRLQRRRFDHCIVC
jgi:hypothetical protein